MSTNRLSIKFYPRTDKKNKQGLIPVYCRIMTDKKIELSTAMWVIMKDWNTKFQRLNKNATNAASFNPQLDSYYGKILDAYSKLFIEGETITANILKERIFGKVVKDKTLLEVVMEHNTMFEKRIGVDYSYGSFKNYKTTRKYLEAFIPYQYKKRDLPLSEVKYGFCEHYFAFLTTQRPCNVNGANKHIQRLKKIINYAYKMGYVQVNSLLSYSLKFQPFQQYKLSWEELNKLQALNLENNTMARVLDVFIFQCFTGLAYADVKKLSKEHIIIGVDGNHWISMSRSKTKQEFAVPLLQPASAILDRYKVCSIREDKLLPVLSNQKMNAYLKVIGDVACINYPLSCHVARHTFATTVTLQEGVPLETVSKLLGHSKIATTQIYSVVTQLKIMKDFKQLSDKLDANGD